MNIQLKLIITDIKPSIWRRVLVSDKSTLLDLHDLIQYCFNWLDYHLHMFEVSGMKFVSVEDWEEDIDRYQDDRIARLGDLIPRFIGEGKVFKYYYDFGDGWVIRIIVEKIINGKPEQKTPRIIGGERSAPPEDVGGVWGYNDFLEALQNATHPDRGRYLEWIGGDYDPEFFDTDEADKTLNQYMRRRKLIRESTWPVGPLYGNFLETTKNKWTESLSPELKAAAADLPLQRDMVTLMTYLKNNKVKGTKALGNFPRKHIRAITADFVNPPTLDIVMEDVTWKLQSEDEVQDLMRYHLLACVSGLIFGGENLTWDLLPQGEMFLSLPPASQVWYLSRVWFRDFNWMFEYDAPDLWPIFDLKRAVVASLTSYPVEENLPIDQVIHDILSTQRASHPEVDLMNLKYFVQRVVIQPLGTFGVLQVNESNPHEKFLSFITGIVVPELGHKILQEQKAYFRLS